MKTSLNVILRLTAIAAAALGMLTSCGTVKGFGNDVERAGTVGNEELPPPLEMLGMLVYPGIFSLAQANMSAKRS